MRRRLSQVFLVDTHYVDRIVRAVGPRETDSFVEIGPGTGTLTVPLLESGATVLAIELDPVLADGLAARLSPAYRDRFRLIREDYLQTDLSRLLGGQGVRLVSNLPYHISGQALEKMVAERGSYQDVHLTLQKEVADRLCAGPGTKEHGLLTVAVGLHFQVTKLFNVPPGAFRPVPGVTSAFLWLEHRSDAPAGEIARAALRLARSAFSARRKALRNSLRPVLGNETETILERAGIDPSARAEDLSVSQYEALARLVLSGSV